jgi:Kef-type K+ transport system membrane component KefB
MRRRISRRLLTLAFLACALPAFAANGHGAESANVVLILAIILLGAKLGGDLAVRVGQPAVLGELLVGVILGNLDLVGIRAFDGVVQNEMVDFLAQLGVLVLLFEVGLESTVGQMLRVGLSSLFVAILGVLAPFGLGWLLSAWLLPTHSLYVHLFIGATLTATSVGITARVLQDLGQSQRDESRIILGAAVIDDVLGLVVLAVVTGAIVAASGGASLSSGGVLWIIGKALLFLVGSLALGIHLSPRLFRLASHLKARGVLLAVGLAFCFLMAWLSHLIGLAPIVGAFAAGLILEDLHYRDFTQRGERTLDQLVEPISSFLVPIFFVLMGMRTELTSFAKPGVLGLAAALTVAAIIGKQVCGLGVIGKNVDRLSVGIGMIPRGEVGLIFANIGLSLKLGEERIVDDATFSAVVVMVIVTTLVTPPALKWSFGRLQSPPRAPG